MVLPISTLTPMITKMISAKRFDSLAKQKERNDEERYKRIWWCQSCYVCFFLNMFWIYLKTSFWVALAIVVQTCFTHNICGICRDFWAQRINKTVCDSTSTTWQWLIHPHNTVLSWNLLTLLSWTRQNPMAAFSPKTFWPPESFFGMPCSPVRRRNWKSFIKLCHTLSTDRPNHSSRKTSEHVPVAAINSNSLFISSWKMVESARSGC